MPIIFISAVILIAILIYANKGKKKNSSSSEKENSSSSEMKNSFLTLEIPQGVSVLSNMNRYPYIKTVIIPKSVKKINDKAFQVKTKYNIDEGAKNLEYIKGDLSGIINIGSKAFEDCINLKEIGNGDLPSVEEVKFRAFCKTAIHSISMPRINFLEEDAFEDCDHLERVILSTKIQKIPMAAFRRCTSLHSLSFYCEEENKYYSSNEEGSIIIPNNIKVIDPLAFEGCNSIQKIKLPPNIELRWECFKNCENLKELYISGTTEIEEAFENCINLKEIGNGNLPSGTKVGKSAFCHTAIHSISMPQIIFLDRNVFTGCNHLERVILSTKIQEIPRGTFCGCTSLHSLSFYSEEENKYYSSNEEGSIIIPNNIKAIGDYAFYGCNSIQKIKLPPNIELRSGCFKYCKNLKELYISGTTEIESNHIEASRNVKIFQY